MFNKYGCGNDGVPYTANCESSTESPRRVYYFEIEKMIYSTIVQIQLTDSDDKLHSAVEKLRSALNDVSDYYDEKIKIMNNVK